MTGNVMVDIETLGSSRVLVPIIQVGLLWFDLTGKVSHDCFSVDLEPQIEKGVAPDPHTITWWENENAELLEAILSDPKKLPPENVKTRIKAFWDRNCGKETLVWAKSPSFDLVKLAEFFRHFNGSGWTPWSFRNERCVRTAITLAGTPEHPPHPHTPVCGVAGNFTKHDALFDCYVQANAVLHAIKALKRP